MALRQLGHVAIRVGDVSKAVEFYEKLGMVNVWKDPDWAYMKAGDDGLALLGPGYRAAGPTTLALSSALGRSWRSTIGACNPRGSRWARSTPTEMAPPLLWQGS